MSPRCVFRNYLEDSIFDVDGSFDIRQWAGREPKKMRAVCTFLSMVLDLRIQWNPTGSKAWHPWIAIILLYNQWEDYRKPLDIGYVCISYFYRIVRMQFNHVNWTHKGPFRQCNLCWDTGFELDNAISEKKEDNQKDIFLVKTGHIEVLKTGKMVISATRTAGEALSRHCMVLQADRGDTMKFWMPSILSR